MVHQELQPIPERTVAENMYTGRYPTKKFGPIQVIDHKKMFEETAKWLDDVKMPYNPKAKLGTMSIAQMQSVEIAKAVSYDSRIVIMDEPTSSLDYGNQLRVLERVRQLARQGYTVLLSTHLLEEVQSFISRAVLLRKGKLVGDCTIDELEEQGKDLRTYVKET